MSWPKTKKQQRIFFLKKHTCKRVMSGVYMYTFDWFDQDWKQQRSRITIKKIGKKERNSHSHVFNTLSKVSNWRGNILSICFNEIIVFIFLNAIALGWCQIPVFSLGTANSPIENTTLCDYYNYSDTTVFLQINKNSKQYLYWDYLHTLSVLIANSS